MELRGRPHPQLVPADPLARRQQRTGRQHAARLDDRAVQHGRTHADETAILDGAGVDDGRVPDGHVIAEDAGKGHAVHMQDRAVLDIRPRADPDEIGVAAQHAVEPDARPCPDLDIAHDHRRRRHPGAGIDP